MRLGLLGMLGGRDPLASDDPKGLPAHGIVTNIWLQRHAEKLDLMRGAGITRLFVDIGGTGKDGRITTPEREMRGFVERVREHEARSGGQFKLLPYSEIIIGRKYDIRARGFGRNFVREYARLASLGYDGALLDIECVSTRDKGSYLDIASQLRDQLPAGSMIAAYTGHLAEHAPRSCWEWDKEFFRQVAERVDLLSIPLYDTSTKNAAQYEEKIRRQLRLSQEGNASTPMLFAVPTHKPPPETMEAALRLYRAEPRPNHAGITVFAEWTMKPHHWEMLRQYL